MMALLQFAPLFESQASKLVGENLRLAEWNTLKLQIERREMALDYYTNAVLAEDGGENRYLRDTFVVNGEAPNVLILEHVPVTQQMIDAKARAYIIQPERNVGKTKAEKYTELLKRGGWFSTSKKVDALTQCLGDIAVQVCLTPEKIPYFPIATEYYPFFAEDDEIQTQPVGILYPTALRDKDGVVLWVFMDAEQKITFKAGFTGKDDSRLPFLEQVKTEPNTYGCFNWFFPHREKPVLGFTTPPRSALIQANQAIDIAKTALNQMMWYNGFKQLVISGVVEGGVGKDLMLGRNRVLVLPPDQASQTQSTASVLDMQAQLMDHIQAIQFSMEMVGQSLNMAFQWKMDGGGVQSGRALEVQNVKDFDDRISRNEVVDETVEQPMFRIFTTISAKFGLGIERGELVVDFPEPEQGFANLTEEVAWETHEMATGRKSAIDYIMEDNPDLDEEQAAKKLENNLKINRLVTSGGVVSETDILAILHDIDKEEAVVEPALGEPGSGQPPEPKPLEPAPNV
jgi:hypothetical protein